MKAMKYSVCRYCGKRIMWHTETSHKRWIHGVFPTNFMTDCYPKEETTVATPYTKEENIIKLLEKTDLH